MNFLKKIWGFVSFKEWRAARRRRRYDELKAMIVQEHLAGYGGLVVPKKYDETDLSSFKAPMYFHAQNQYRQRCIFWRKDLMTKEVGPPTKEVCAQPEDVKFVDGVPARQGTQVKTAGIA
jgi:hypothetical protein